MGLSHGTMIPFASLGVVSRPSRRRSGNKPLLYWNEIDECQKVRLFDLSNSFDGGSRRLKISKRQRSENGLAEGSVFA